MLRILVCLIALASVAEAQPRSVNVMATEELHQSDDVPAGIGGGLVFGWGGQKDGPRGWVARFDYELFPFYDAGAAGGFFGFQPGIEAWSSGADNWGFSMPFLFVVGVRAFPFRASIGAGCDLMLVDQVNDDTGFGLYAPLAAAKLGVDVFGFQVGADARLGYRWQFGADDHTRWQLGIFAAKTFTPPPFKRGFKRATAVAAD
jgi:hypothetical protein